MAVRIRTSGEIVCAAMHPEQPGDRYIDDYWHYELSAVHELLVTDADHLWLENGEVGHGRWWWNRYRFR